MTQRRYFLAPSFDIAANSPAAPRLGSIIPDFAKLKTLMNRDEVLPVLEHPSSQVGVSDFRADAGKATEVSLSVGADLAPGGLGNAEVAYTFASGHYDTFECDWLDTIEFGPSEKFVRDSINNSQNVQAFFNSGSCLEAKQGYMTTGLKIATGFTATRKSSTKHRPSVQINIGTAGFGVPLSVVPKFGAMAGSSLEISHGPATSEIVFAYRAVAIKLKGDGSPQIKEIPGGLCSTGGDGKEKEKEQSWDMEPAPVEHALKTHPDEKIVPIQVRRV